MKSQKGFIIPLIIAIAIILIVGGIYWYYKTSYFSSSVVCTMDAMQCPDGSYVGRSGPACKFVCPISESGALARENDFCGGIAGIKCASGLTCKYDGTYPDAGGKCINTIK